MDKFKCILLFLILTVARTGWSNDTLKLNIRQADSIFLHRNMNLLVSGLNIEAKKAQVGSPGTELEFAL